MESEEPSIRNSNLFPVKAKGEVLFLSVSSCRTLGSALTPIVRLFLLSDFVAYPVPISCSTTPCNWLPIKQEIIAGGASSAPSLWSFPTFAADMRRSSLCVSTAASTQASTRRNCMFSCGLSPGFIRLMPSSVLSDQLLCFPEPFTPENGFSWSRHSRPCREATFFKLSITSWLWSREIFASSYTTASSCWDGATSLCSVFTGTPRLQSSSSRSRINSAILLRIIP